MKENGFFCFKDFALKGHVLPLFGPSLFIVKWLCFKLKIEHLEWFNTMNTIYIRKVHTKSNHLKKIKMICHVFISNINWRDVQTKNVANNVDMSCLRAPWQKGPYKNDKKARTKTSTRDDTKTLTTSWYLFCQNRPFRTVFFPQVHTRMSLHQKYFKNLDKMATITNIWPYATDTT